MDRAIPPHCVYNNFQSKWTAPAYGSVQKTTSSVPKWFRWALLLGKDTI